MHLFSSSPPAGLLVACMGVAHVAAAEKPTSGVVEVDLVFPRNQTYAPKSSFPVVWAFQNPELVPALNPLVRFDIWNLDDLMNGTVLSTTRDMIRWANFSSRDPYLDYEFYSRLNTEGHWLLKWEVYWESYYTEDPQGIDKQIEKHIMKRSITFTTSNSAPEIDLVAATDNKDCSEDLGVTVNVTETAEILFFENWSGGHSFPKVASSTPTPEPCRVKLDSTTTSSMAASLTAQACNSGNIRPVPDDIDCPPEDKSAAHQLAVGAVACLAAAIGAMGYMMM